MLIKLGPVEKKMKRKAFWKKMFGRGESKAQGSERCSEGSAGTKEMDTETTGNVGQGTWKGKERTDEAIR